MEANIYLKFERITADEEEQIQNAIKIMEKIERLYSKCYGRADVLGFDDAKATLNAILADKLFKIKRVL